MVRWRWPGYPASPCARASGIATLGARLARPGYAPIVAARRIEAESPDTTPW
jgi:hypothetical protein